TRRKHDAVFAPWRALADLPEKDFAAKAPALCAGFARPGSKVNPRIAKALADSPPKTLKEAAQCYAAVLNAADRAGPAAPAQEELRRLFHAPDAAPNVPMALFGDLALLPDRASQATLQALVKALETWRASGPGAPPRAMVLEDTPAPHSPRVFLRGNP